MAKHSSLKELPKTIQIITPRINAIASLLHCWRTARVPRPNEQYSNSHYSRPLEGSIFDSLYCSHTYPTQTLIA